MQNRKIVFFDGVCNFCNFNVDFIWRNNKKRNLFYTSLQSNFAKEKLLSSGIYDVNLRTIYFFDGSKFYDKSQAVFMIFKNLDGYFYPLLSKVNIIIPLFITNFFYDIISKNRYSIMGKRDSCRIPNKEEGAFFIN